MNESDNVFEQQADQTLRRSPQGQYKKKPFKQNRSTIKLGQLPISRSQQQFTEMLNRADLNGGSEIDATVRAYLDDLVKFLYSENTFTEQLDYIVDRLVAISVQYKLMCKLCGSVLSTMWEHLSHNIDITKTFRVPTIEQAREKLHKILNGRLVKECIKKHLSESLPEVQKQCSNPQQYDESVFFLYSRHVINILTFTAPIIRNQLTGKNEQEPYGQLITYDNYFGMIHYILRYVCSFAVPKNDILAYNEQQVKALASSYMASLNRLQRYVIVRVLGTLVYTQMFNIEPKMLAEHGLFGLIRELYRLAEPTSVYLQFKDEMGCCNKQLPDKEGIAEKIHIIPVQPQFLQENREELLASDKLDLFYQIQLSTHSNSLPLSCQIVQHANEVFAQNCNALLQLDGFQKFYQMLYRDVFQDYADHRLQKLHKQLLLQLLQRQTDSSYLFAGLVNAIEYGYIGLRDLVQQCNVRGRFFYNIQTQLIQNSYQDTLNRLVQLGAIGSQSTAELQRAISAYNFPYADQLFDQLNIDLSRYVESSMAFSALKEQYPLVLKQVFYKTGSRQDFLNIFHANALIKFKAFARAVSYSEYLSMLSGCEQPGYQFHFQLPPFLIQAFEQLQATISPGMRSYVRHFMQFITAMGRSAPQMACVIDANTLVDVVAHCVDHTGMEESQAVQLILAFACLGKVNVGQLRGVLREQTRAYLRKILWTLE